MTDQAQPTPTEAQQQQDASLPDVRVPAAKGGVDLATIFGLVLTFALIASAIMIGDSDASFFNVPSMLIVVLGTFTATCVSFTPREILQSWTILKNTTTTHKRDYANIARALLSLAVIGKKKGILGLAAYEDQMETEPFMAETIQMAVDGYKPEQIETIVRQKIDAQLERHKRTAMFTKRASEVAPAMGLIGTLVGLVQMLAELENPESIGPAMALALLTTFYGAILGTIVMSPLSAKLEKNSLDEALFQTMAMETAISIAKQENPRSLELKLNSELPPSERIVYFD